MKNDKLESMASMRNPRMFNQPNWLARREDAK